MGDRVWYAGRKGIQERVTCPECFGKRCLTVILGDDSKVTIDCAGCAAGYKPPKGYVLHYKQIVDVSQITIDGVEINPKEVRYKFDNYRMADGTDVFSSKEAAEIRAKELAEEYNKQEHERIHRKEKNNRTWSWHVHYYRKMIRDAKKTIERAEERLGIARTKQSQKEDSNAYNNPPEENQP
jgi:hypothetical protein